VVYEAFSTSDVSVILKTPSKECTDDQRTAQSNVLRGQEQGGWFKRAFWGSLWRSCQASS